MQPKVQILTMDAFQDLTVEEHSNQTTSGYHHTCFCTDDLNLENLMRYPTDSEFAAASRHVAFHGAEQLLGALGIDTKTMLAAYVELTPSVTKKNKPTPNSQPPRTLHQLLKLYQSSCQVTRMSL
jgi:hypothetical protein